MPATNYQFPSQISTAEPMEPQGSRNVSDGDDWFRVVLRMEKGTWPNIAGPVTVTHTDLNNVVRAVLTPAGETQLVLPTAAARANKLQGYDATGAPSVTRSLTAFDADVQATASNAGIASGAAGVAVPAAAASTAARDLSQKWATQPAGEVVVGQGYSSFYYSTVAAGYKADVQQLKVDTAQIKVDTQGFATAAAASAAQAGAPLTGTSATSLTLGLGSKTLTTQTGKAWVAGQMVVLPRIGAPVTQRMSGTITAYDPATGSMTVLIAEFTGTGTFTDWTIGVTGPRGASSLTLPVQQVSTNLTGVSNVIYALTAAVTVTMPAAPADGDFFGFSNRSAGQPSVNPNGKTIKGVAGTLILDSPAASALLRYDAATNDWVESFQGFTVASISSNAVFVQPNTWTGKQTFQGFTVLGDASIKVKVLSGTTAAAQGGDSALIAHGVDASKIVSMTAVAGGLSGGTYVGAEYTASGGLQFSLLAGASGVLVRNHPTNSSGVLSKPVVVTIAYTE